MADSFFLSVLIPLNIHMPIAVEFGGTVVVTLIRKANPHMSKA